MVKSANQKPLFFGIFGPFLIGALVIAGCSQNSKPKGVLGKEEMVRTMTSLYLAEQKVSSVGVTRDSTVLIFHQMTPKVFEKSSTTDSVFRMSFDYYMAHPIEMEEIYTALIDSLNLREQQMISNEVKK